MRASEPAEPALSEVEGRNPERSEGPPPKEVVGANGFELFFSLANPAPNSAPTPSFYDLGSFCLARSSAICKCGKVLLSGIILLRYPHVEGLVRIVLRAIFLGIVGLIILGSLPAAELPHIKMENGVGQLIVNGRPVF